MDKSMEYSGTFKVEDYVTYRKNGVCQIAEITQQSFVGQGKKDYYVLRSVYDSNIKVFVPLGSELEKEMKRVLSKDEIHKVIDESKDLDGIWADDCKSRANLFEQIIADGDKAKMIWIIRRISAYKLEVEGQKKKMKANDLKYLALAETVIAGEFAFSLGLQKNEVIKYINDYLDK